MSLCGNNNPCPDLITGQKCGITYTGARYVPLFADPAEWSSSNAYEPLTIVIHEGNSYTSKTFVPVGVDISNEQYWALTGNYNAQVEAYRKEVLALSKNLTDLTNEYNGISPDFNAQVITQEMGVNAGLQYIIDTASNQGFGRILLKGTYELTEPLIINRLNENTNLSIIFYGNGVIKKGANFKGDRLIQIKMGFHDEDNIIFDNISFDGVDKTVNAIDNYDMLLPYNQDPTDKAQHNESKFIRFNNCSFSNCYMGVKLSSLSYTFTGCIFTYCNYGAYLNCSSNNNTFLGCSFRHNLIGVAVISFDSTLGTLGNSFFGCIFESNANLGYYSSNQIDSEINGCYFEYNGYQINADFPHHPTNQQCHCYFNDFGLQGGTRLYGSYFAPATTGSGTSIYGSFTNSFFVLMNGNIGINFAKGCYIYTRDSLGVIFNSSSTYESSFQWNGTDYIGKANSEILVEKSKVLKGNNTVQDKTAVIDLTNTITTDSARLFTITLPTTTNAFNIRLGLKISLIGRTAGGYSLSAGYVIGNLLINQLGNSFKVNVSDVKMVENSGATLANGVTGPNLFKASPTITATANNRELTFTLNGINVQGVQDYGAIDRILVGGYIDTQLTQASQMGAYFTLS